MFSQISTVRGMKNYLFKIWWFSGKFGATRKSFFYSCKMIFWPFFHADDIILKMIKVHRMNHTEIFIMSVGLDLSQLWVKWIRGVFDTTCSRVHQFASISCVGCTDMCISKTNKNLLYSLQNCRCVFVPLLEEDWTDKIPSCKPAELISGLKKFSTISTFTWL